MDNDTLLTYMKGFNARTITQTDRYKQHIT